jgi:hypothetical protein
MNLKEYIEKLKQVRAVLSDDNEIAKAASLVANLEFLAVYKKRIFQIGLTSVSYSSRPFYASVSKKRPGLPKGKLKPKGKNGKAKFKNGKTKKSQYLRGGYREFRQVFGRQTSAVDFNLTGTSFQSIQLVFRGRKLVVGSTSAERLNILRGNEKRFKINFLTATEDEIKRFAEAVKREFQITIRNIIK